MITYIDSPCPTKEEHNTIIAEAGLLHKGPVFFLLFDAENMRSSTTIKRVFEKAGRINDLNLVVVEYDEEVFEEQEKVIEYENLPVVGHYRMSLEDFTFDAHIEQYKFNVVYIDSTSTVLCFPWNEVRYIIDSSITDTANIYFTMSCRANRFVPRSIEFTDENRTKIQYNDDTHESCDQLIADISFLYAKIPFREMDFDIVESESKIYIKKRPLGSLGRPWPMVFMKFKVTKGPETTVMPHYPVRKRLPPGVPNYHKKKNLLVEDLTPMGWKRYEKFVEDHTRRVRIAVKNAHQRAFKERRPVSGQDVVNAFARINSS